MNTYSQNISNWLNEENFLDVVSNYLEQNPNYQHPVNSIQVSLGHSIELFNYLKGIVLEAIENESFEALSITNQNQIHNQIHALHTNRNNIDQFITQVDGWYYNISLSGLENKLKGFTTFKKTLSDIANLRRSYSWAIKGLGKLEEKEKLISSKLASISQQVEKSSVAHNEVLKIRETVADSFNEFTADKNRIDVLIQEVQTFQRDQFNPTRQQFLDEENGVNAIISDSRQKNKTITNLENQAAQRFKELTTYIQNYQNKLGVLNEVEAAITELQKKTQDPEHGISVILEHINKTRSQVDDAYEKIKSSIKIITEFEVEIESKKKEADEAIEKITISQKDAEDVQGKVNEIYQIIAKTAMGAEFAKARDHYDQERKSWFIRMLLVIGILIVAAILVSVFKFELTEHKNFNIFLRYSILSPLIYLLVFTSQQYKKSNLSHEKYMYKWVLSFSLEPQAKILQTHFPGHKDAILSFILDKLNKQFAEPFFDQAMDKEYQVKQDEIKYGKVCPDDNIPEDYVELDKEESGQKDKSASEQKTDELQA